MLADGVGCVKGERNGKQHQQQQLLITRDQPPPFILVVFFLLSLSELLMLSKNSIES
jgi:hypothetical protein